MSNTMGFKRNKEDFTCEHCKAEVSGDGYTNHCPKCLFSRHVDVIPGDRAASCGGLMEPVAYSVKNGEGRLLHLCQVCGYEKENRIADEDDRSAVLEIVKEAVDRFAKETK